VGEENVGSNLRGIEEEKSEERRRRNLRSN